MPYPIIMNGDHAEFQAEWAASGKTDKDRPDWPLPSFDARDWAEAFCKIATNLGYKDAEGKPIDEGWMISWFANSLMRGYDEHAARMASPPLPWDAYNNRNYDPVEKRAAEIYDGFVAPDHVKKPAWVRGGNSTKQDEARQMARAELRAAGHGA